MTSAWPRWLPVGVVGVVIVAGAVAVPLSAGAAVDLPDKTPEQVLALVGDSTVEAFSGTFEQSSELGLPQLPTGGSAEAEGAASALELLTGTHTARVYVNGPTDARVQVLDRLGERDAVRHGNEVWLYDSDDNSAIHLTLPDGAGAANKDMTVPGEAQTPAQVAGRLLAAIEPSTTVTVGTDQMVAGRTVYELVLNPKSSETLVESASIAVDSETGLPLRVEVRARGQQEPAFRLAFTALSLDTPSADLFSWSPPAGATVEEQKVPAHEKGAPADPVPADPAVPDPATQAPPFTVHGTGWESVIELPAGAVPVEVTASPVFGQIASAVPGGRLLSTALVNVLLTDDGRVLAGSVPLDRLQAAAAEE